MEEKKGRGKNESTRNTNRRLSLRPGPGPVVDGKTSSAAVRALLVGPVVEVAVTHEQGVHDVEHVGEHEEVRDLHGEPPPAPGDRDRVQRDHADQDRDPAEEAVGGDHGLLPAGRVDEEPGDPEAEQDVRREES